MLPSHTTHINRKGNLSRLVSAQGPPKEVCNCRYCQEKTQNPSQRIFTQKRVGVEGQGRRSRRMREGHLGVFDALLWQMCEKEASSGRHSALRLVLSWIPWVAVARRWWLRQCLSTLQPPRRSNKQCVGFTLEPFPHLQVNDYASTDFCSTCNSGMFLD